MEIYIGTYDGSITVLHASLSEIKPFLNFKVSQNSIKNVQLVGKSEYLVAGGFDQELKVVGLSDYSQKIEAKENVGQIVSICRLGDKSFFTGGNDGTIRLWSCQEWGIVKESKKHSRPVSQMVTDASGKLMMSVGGNKMNIWNARSLQVAYEYKLPQDECIEGLAISDSLSKVFISTAKGELKIINTENNELYTLFKLQLPRKIQKFLYWQGFILVATDKGEVMAWKVEAQDSEVIQKEQLQHKVWFQAHKSRIKDFKIAYEDYLVVATASGEISIWDFPQFLSSIDGISQDYHLEGLQPLCTYTAQGRILSLEVKEMGKLGQENQQQPEAQKQQAEEAEQADKLPKKHKKLHKQNKNRKLNESKTSSIKNKNKNK